ncbi:hypothetical protein DPMN_012513 [Dreissena polymorpha]|uniref:Uncharacterized protein n=1 Tax=Dreissena polymorpha TaxID=45954 RepID=A0A9D4S2W3_DREPO|nr:hypothetical protein DPMN_012513 [Dreissena polymorpha]
MEERHQTVFQHTSGRAMDQDNYPGRHYTPKNVSAIKLNIFNSELEHCGFFRFLSARGRYKHCHEYSNGQ